MSAELFPAPSASSFVVSPRPLAGINHESTETLRAVLKDNHERWHIFFNEMGFHNHASHYSIALWALGADREIIQAAYDHDCTYQLAALDSPGEITADNFKDHLGDAKYYTAYRKFFANVVQTKDIASVLEEYVFDRKANFDGSSNTPEMLNRFFDGLIHPMIHAGYGAEFNLPGMIVEGLASTAVHDKAANVLTPPSLWEPRPNAKKPTKNVHALSIIGRILKDPRFDGVGQEPVRTYFEKFLKQHGETLKTIVDEWSYDNSDPKEVERKIEELVLANTVLYGVGGWTKDKDFNADFTFMHLVTSSIFLSSTAALLKPASQELFLRTYFTFSLLIWLINGRTPLDVAGFFSTDTAYPIPPHPLPQAYKGTLPSEASPKSRIPNPWFPIINNALTILDDHLPKIQRALLHFAQVYGTHKAGYLKDIELPGAELIDSSIFLRVAGLTDKRVVQLLKAVDESAVSGPLTLLWDRRIIAGRA